MNNLRCNVFGLSGMTDERFNALGVLKGSYKGFMVEAKKENGYYMATVRAYLEPFKSDLSIVLMTEETKFTDVVALRDAIKQVVGQCPVKAYELEKMHSQKVA